MKFKLIFIALLAVFLTGATKSCDQIASSPSAKHVIENTGAYKDAAGNIYEIAKSTDGNGTSEQV